MPALHCVRRCVHHHAGVPRLCRCSRMAGSHESAPACKGLCPAVMGSADPACPASCAGVRTQARGTMTDTPGDVPRTGRMTFSCVAHACQMAGMRRVCRGSSHTPDLFGRYARSAAAAAHHLVAYPVEYSQSSVSRCRCTAHRNGLQSQQCLCLQGFSWGTRILIFLQQFL